MEGTTESPSDLIKDVLLTPQISQKNFPIINHLQNRLGWATKGVDSFRIGRHELSPYVDKLVKKREMLLHVLVCTLYALLCRRAD